MPKNNKEYTSVHSARFTRQETIALYKLLEIMRKQYGCRSLNLSDVLRNCFNNECSKYNLLNTNDK